MSVTLRRIRTTQPQTNVQTLNGLPCIIPSLGLLNTSGGAVSITGTVPFVATSGGVASSHSNAATNILRTVIPGRIGTSGGASLLVVFSTTETTLDKTISGFGSEQGSSGNTLFKLGTGATSAANLRATVGGSNENFSFDCSGTVINDGKTHAAIVTLSSFSNWGTAKVFLDGRQVGSVATEPLGVESTYSSIIAGGNRRAGTNSGGATCNILAVIPFAYGVPDAQAIEYTRNPWQIFAPQQRFISLTSGSGTTYNITPSGSISFSGTPVRNNRKILSSSGIITFNGSAPITLVNGATTYTITPTGNISLTGSATNIRKKVISSSGVLTLSGSSIFKRTRTFISTGVLSMLGTSIPNKTKIYTPTGNITFSGTATMYMPGVTVQTTKLPLTGVGT